MDDSTRREFLGTTIVSAAALDSCTGALPRNLFS
jgi:hypothetical protein